MPLSCASANTPTVPDPNPANMQVTANENEALGAVGPSNNVVATADCRKCFYCERSFHRRERCPARNASCIFGHKTGHFANVCKSKRGKVSAVVKSNIICSILSDPHSCASVPFTINGACLHAMIDSGSCVSFIHPNAVSALNLNVLPSKKKICMASSPFSSVTVGHCSVPLNVQNNHYHNFKLSILPNLCYKIITGQDFMKLHK